MTYSLYSYFEQHPIEGIVYILFSLIITLIIYGAFPLIIASSRKKTITAKRYKFLCYMVNFFVCFMFGVMNGASMSVGPYLLWTFVFVKFGFRTLLYKGLIKGFENLKSFNEEIGSLTDTYKNEFLTREKFHNQNNGSSFFDDIKHEITSFSLKKSKKAFEHIFKNNLSIEDYLLEYLDERTLELIEKGNLDDIVKQNGRTYDLSRIYEFVNDCLLEKGRLIQIQHQNKLAYIDYLCEENAKNNYKKSEIKKDEDNVKIVSHKVINKENGSSNLTSFDDDEKQCIKENNTTDNKINETTNNMTTEEDKSLELNQEIAFCRKCGTQLLKDSEFCHKCGCEKVH